MGRSTAASGGRHRENRGGSEINGQKNVLVVSHGMAISAFLSAVNPEIVVGELETRPLPRLFMMEDIYCNGKCK